MGTANRILFEWLFKLCNIIWRKNPDKTIQMNVLQRIFFSLSPSRYLIKVKKKKNLNKIRYTDSIQLLYYK